MFVSCLFKSYFSIMTKIILKTSNTLNSYSILLLKVYIMIFLSFFAIIYVFIFHKNPREIIPNRKNMYKVIARSVLSVLSLSSLLFSLNFLSISDVFSIYYTYPVFVMILSIIFLKEKADFMDYICIVSCIYQLYPLLHLLYPLFKYCIYLLYPISKEVISMERS